MSIEDKNKIKDWAEKLITAHNGIQSGKLFSRLCVEFLKADTLLIGQAIAELVLEGRIQAIHYGPTGEEYSMFFPKGYKFILKESDGATTH